MIVFKSSDGISAVGMKSDKISCDNSGKESLAHLVSQSAGRVGISVGMYRPPFGARPVSTA